MNTNTKYESIVVRDQFIFFGGGGGGGLAAAELVLNFSIGLGVHEFRYKLFLAKIIDGGNKTNLLPFLPEFAQSLPEFPRILPKFRTSAIFFFFGGGGHSAPPCPPSPTPML